MKEKIILVLKGFIVGLGKIIPGVSGAMLAITLGIYDKCIDAISNFTKNIKNNINLLFFVCLGIVISIGICSNIVIFLLNNYYFITICLFIGLMLGGIPKLYKDSKVDVKNLKNIILIIITFLIIILINIINPNHMVKMNANFLILIALGFLEAFAMVIPGISGTALLMMIGYYDLVILRFSQIFNIAALFDTIEFFIPFGLGMLLGVIIMSKIINYCFKHYPIKTYCIIFGLILSSIIILLSNLISFNNFFLGLIFIIIGFLISYFLEYTIKSK